MHFEDNNRFCRLFKTVVFFHTLQIGAKCSGLFVFEEGQQCQGLRRFPISAGGCIQVYPGAFKTIEYFMKKGL